MDELKRAIERDIGKDLTSRFEAAIDETGEDAVGIIWTHVPFAFGELHNSIRYVKALRATIADAPHAAPVEVGSIPHMPPVEPLVVWATMRGMNDPKSAAWAIAKKIEAEGTKPTFYMRGSLPEIRAKLHENMKKAART